jgi:hypothetical protein
VDRVQMHRSAARGLLKHSSDPYLVTQSARWLIVSTQQERENLLFSRIERTIHVLGCLPLRHWQSLAPCGKPAAYPIAAPDR